MHLMLRQIKNYALLVGISNLNPSVTEMLKWCNNVNIMHAVYRRITSIKCPSFCMGTFSASLTNLTTLPPQSRDYSCYVICKQTDTGTSTQLSLWMFFTAARICYCSEQKIFTRPDDCAEFRSFFCNMHNNNINEKWKLLAARQHFSVRGGITVTEGPRTRAA
jgi:hypothetical protein